LASPAALLEAILNSLYPFFSDSVQLFSRDESLLGGPRQRLRLHLCIIQCSIGQTVNAMGNPLTSQRDNRHSFFLPRLEPHCRTGWNGETKSKGLATIELQRPISFEKVAMGPYLNWPVG
jgi:hypothetical protein